MSYCGELLETLGRPLSMGGLATQTSIAHSFSHSVQTHAKNYHGAQITAGSTAAMDAAWQTIIGVGPDEEHGVGAPSRDPCLWQDGEDSDAAMADLAEKLYGEGATFRTSQAQAVRRFIQGDSIVCLDAVSGGKSAVFLSAAMLAGKRSQFLLLMCPLRSVSLSAKSQAQAIGVSTINLNSETAEAVVAELTRIDTENAWGLSFSFLVCSFEFACSSSQFGVIFRLGVKTGALCRLVFDEALLVALTLKRLGVFINGIAVNKTLQYYHHHVARKILSSTVCLTF